MPRSSPATHAAKPDVATPEDDPLALERQVCFALVVAARTVLTVYRPILEPLGLTHPQYLVMLALWGDSPLSLTELSRLLDLEPATLSPLVKRLEAAGLVRRSREPGDERRLRVELTDAGTALRTRALSVPPTVVQSLGMDLAELERLRDGLSMVIDHARNATHPARAGR